VRGKLRLLIAASAALALANGASASPGQARPAPPDRVLATGDSMIQIIDSFLKDRLGAGGIRVKSDARISTGISKPFMLDWVRHARRQARRIRPDVTVVFIGANDGFPIGGANCCGEPWIDGYARRARQMMASYARGGRSRVYWLLLPAPRGGNFRRVFTAVNTALVRAASGQRGARLIHLEKVFTPGGRFRPVIRWHGRLVHARQDDGVHLSRSGASIAANLVIRAIRRDGAWVRLGRRRAARDRVVPPGAS
jgi:uncharacterized protein